MAMLGTPRPGKNPAHQKKQQRQRKDHDVCIHAQHGWDSSLVAQSTTIMGDCGGAEPKAAKDAEPQYSRKTYAEPAIRLVKPQEMESQNGDGGVRSEEPNHVHTRVRSPLRMKDVRLRQIDEWWKDSVDERG